MNYTVVCQGKDLAAFQKSVPVIDDIPRGTAMRIQFTPPAWVTAPGGESLFYTQEEQSALYAKYWWNIAKQYFEGADKMKVVSVYREGNQVVVEGYATGWVVVLLIIVVVVCATALGIAAEIKDIKISADAVEIAQMKAGVAQSLADEIRDLVSAGFDADAIRDILEAQGLATEAVNPPEVISSGSSALGDITGLLKWGIIGFLVFQALGLFKELRAKKPAASEE